MQQFSDFYNRNFPNDIEQAIELYSIFGGLDIDIDCDKHYIDLIKEHIYYPFNALRERVSKPLDDKAIEILIALAKGDRREHSIFKRSHLGFNRGESYMRELVTHHFIYKEYSKETPPIRTYPKQKFKKEVENHIISHKYRFIYPYMRFWFAFIEPFYHSISMGDYSKSIEHIQKHLNSFIGFTFEELCGVYIKEIFAPTFTQNIYESGSYWDKDVEIDLYYSTFDGDIYVGECKWTNHKINKKELHKLKDKISLANIPADKILLFSKRGFSNELLKMKEDNLYLINSKELETLTRSL